GNLDCTFCLDCVAACPHDNVGILATAPARDLAGSARRPFSARPDLAALALVVVFGAFANAAGMTEPVLAWETGAAARLGLSSTMPIITIWLALALLVLPALLCLGAAAAARRLARLRVPLRTIGCRFALACVPLGLAMWSAHFFFHFVTAAGTLRPVVQRIATDVGGAVFGTPAFAAAG